MQDLYKGFKKVAEDDNSATLKHDNGHELNIAKSGLSRKHKVQLEKLPLHQADGTELGNGKADELLKEMEAAKAGQMQQEPKFSGQTFQPTAEQLNQPEESLAYRFGKSVREKEIDPMVQDVKEYANAIRSAASKVLLNPAADIIQGYGKLGSGVAGVAKDVGAGLTNQPMPQEPITHEQYTPQAEAYLAEPQFTEPQLKQAAAPQAQTQVQTQTTPIPSTPAMQPGRALMAEAAKIMTPEEIISSPNTNVMQKINAHNQMYLDAIKRKAAADDEFQQAMRDKKIDPNRVYHDMSTGRKIRTIIGMLLGGMSAGILRTENPLLKMLNEEIERDVNLQKQDKSDAMNMFKVHYERFGDEAMAHQQAANNLRAAALMEMETALGKLDPNSPMGRLAIQSAADSMRLQSAQARAGMAAMEQRKKILAMLQSGQTQNVDPAELVNMLVTDDGAKAKALEEIKDAQNLAANANKIINAFDKAAEERGVGGRIQNFPGVWKRSEYANVLEQMLDPFFKDIAGQNREATKQATFARIMPEFWDKDSDIPKKRQALIDWMRATKAAPVSKSYGLDLDKFSSTIWSDPTIEKEKMFTDWAKRNVKNPDPKVQTYVQFIKNKYGF